MEIPVNVIKPNPRQPRQVFDRGELEALARTIREHGVIQPVSVSPDGNGGYFLTDGERRWRGAQIAGLDTIPAVVQEVEDGERLILALIANIQRADLVPGEEGRAYVELRGQGYSLDAVANAVGKSRKHVEDRIFLVENLDPEILELVDLGRIHRDRRLASALIEIPDSEARVHLARKLAESGAALKPAIAACEKVGAKIREEQVFQEFEGGPAMSIARHRAKKHTVPTPEWNALFSVGKVPPWQAVADAAYRTCDTCDLREIASEKTCAPCPAVAFLQTLLETRP